MARYDFRTPRLCVEAAIAAQRTVTLDRPQANYLVNVLRLSRGDSVLVFNGRDGEWRARLAGNAKQAELAVEERTRAQPAPGDLHFLFAPLKHARLDYMAQKAVEMGASRLQPVLTRHTQVARINLARLKANAIEAAEQCGILALPEIGEPTTFASLISGFDRARLLVFCDEGADIHDPVAALAAARAPDGSAMPLAVMIGPEGGFAPEEREALTGLPRAVRLSLGPRILRADTAAVAALALVGAVLGDWR